MLKNYNTKMFPSQNTEFIDKNDQFNILLNGYEGPIDLLLESPMLIIRLLFPGE